MDNQVFRILFNYSAFGGPLYKFYAKWSQKEGIINFEIESVYPDRKEKGTLNEEQSQLFLEKYNCLIENRDNFYDGSIESFERFFDVPSYQILYSEGISEMQFDTWQSGNEYYDKKPLYEMILLCDDKAKFLESE